MFFIHYGRFHCTHHSLPYIWLLTLSTITLFNICTLYGSVDSNLCKHYTLFVHVQASSMQLPILTFWLANITHLLGSLHTKRTGQTSSQTGLKAGVSGGIVTSDLSVCADDLEVVGQTVYRDLFQLIHNKIQPLVGPFKCCIYM